MECKHIVLVVALYLVTCSSVSAVVRRYFIAADEHEWNYAPTGRDLIFSHQRYARLFVFNIACSASRKGFGTSSLELF